MFYHCQHNNSKFKSSFSSSSAAACNHMQAPKPGETGGHVPNNLVGDNSEYSPRILTNIMQICTKRTISCVKYPNVPGGNTPGHRGGRGDPLSHLPSAQGEGKHQFQARTQITCLSLDVEQKSAPMAITRYGGQCSRQPVFHPIP